MLRKEEMSSWVVEGRVGCENSRGSHLMPKRLKSCALVFVVGCGHLEPTSLSKEGLLFLLQQ